ncbi:type II secretion system F family protein [Solirhodobacter olei]|uniref:type II secretion system F family protein n=1 Tax=Solirhodobacter olei TaxID=2493082 RepID=UPI000FD818EB|nr:type II secretion system F family protein [Solirhodobacter olei]
MLAALVVFLMAFFGFSALGLGLLILADRQMRKRRARLRRYSLVLSAERVAAAVRRERSQSRHGAPGRRWLTGLARDLERAGIGARPEVVVAVFGLVALPLSFWAARFTGAGAVAAPVIGLAGGWLILIGVIRARAEFRAQAFTDALPDALDTFARGLRAGRPVVDSIRLVAGAAEGRVQQEFERCSREIGVGMSLAAALDGISRRVGTAEARFIAMAIGLQAETGGNLIETFDNLASLIRDRRKLRRKIRALAAETRVSGWILGTLPFVVGGVILFLSPRYLRPLVTDPRGHAMLGFAAASLLLGVLSMRRLGRIEI